MKVHILKHVVLGLAVIAAISAGVMLLWNWLMPEIFGLTTISLLQALGLLALARILFSSMGGKRWMHAGMPHHRNPIRERLMKMSAEERKEYINRKFLKHGFGSDSLQQNESEKQG
ncbi:MAG: hypothetical protein LBQ28_02670 [Prevotellaceae bacterium]|jgi:hypothetical protein|nr:hypothetical protein [Prevotellaceae bacterium]